MKAYSPNIAAMRKKVKKVHKKARFVGLLYLLGTLALVVLSLLPCTEIKFSNGKQLSILSFFSLFGLVFKGNIAAILILLAYLTLIFVALYCFFRIFSRFRRVMKKNERNVNACNRNVSAMEDMGDIFSFIFSSTVVLYMLIFVLTPSEGGLMIERDKPVLTLLGYIFLGVGALIHFVAGTIGGTSSLFIVGVSVEEKKREDKIITYVIRNLVQVVVAAVFVYFVLPVCTIYMYVADFSQIKGLTSDIMVLLGVVLQILAVLFMIFCVKGAIGTREFNLMGMEAYGMHKFAIFSLITGLVCVGAFVVDKNWIDNSMIFNYLFAGVAGILGFVLNLVIKPRQPRKEEEGRDWDDVKEKEEKAPAKGAQAQQQAAQPQVQPMALPNTIDLRVMMPRGMYPNMAPQQQQTVNAAPMKWEVTCPTCGKTLQVKDSSPYHRCPVCGKVFQLRKGKLAEGLGAPVDTVEEEPGKDGKKNKKVKKEKVQKQKPVKTKKEKTAKKEEAPAKMSLDEMDMMAE